MILKIVLRFGLLGGALMLLLLVSQYNYRSLSFQTELKITLFAIMFVLFGYVMSRLVRRKDPESPQSFILNEKKQWELGISKRELQVLDRLSQGMSNLEIAENLFISESTVKTHVSNILLKLNAKRRTEAITLARQHGLIP
jgi:DNA-binding NarL/FixJ family response regulator